MTLNPSPRIFRSADLWATATARKAACSEILIPQAVPGQANPSPIVVAPSSNEAVSHPSLTTEVSRLPCDSIYLNSDESKNEAI